MHGATVKYFLIRSEIRRALRNVIRKLIPVMLVSMIVIVVPSAIAQNANTASIQGTINDASGAVVSNASISLVNVATNQTLRTSSNSSGFFVFTNLSAANYKVTVDKAGFADWIATLTLRVSQAAQIHPTLAAATVSTHVFVRNVTPVIDRVNPTLADVKSATLIEAMPIQGRNVLSALAFSPGVVANSYGGSGGAFTRVNGIPGSSVEYLTDGNSSMNTFSDELNISPQSTMTLQEVSITTSNGSAQFGRPGVVQMITKGGTNQFHGQVFELNRNQHLQARQFHSGPTVPFLQHNEYGFQVGGPIVRNHTFFFFDMEWMKEQSNVLNQYVVPTDAQRHGDLSDLVDATGNSITIYDPTTTTFNPVTGTYVRTPFPGNVVPTNRLNPVAQKVLGVIPVPGVPPYPLPNISGQPYWTGAPNYQPSSQKGTSNIRQITVKVDQVFGTSRLSGRYSKMNYDRQQFPGWGPLSEDVRVDGYENGSLSLTSVVSPRAVNVFHFGVNYNTHSASPVAIPGVPEKLGLPQYPNSISYPSMSWGNGNDSYWGNINYNGSGLDSAKANPNQVVSADDQLSWNPGNQQFVLGIQANNSRTTYTEELRPTGLGGNYNFSGSFTALQDPTQAANGVYDVPTTDTGSGLADLLLGDTDQLQLTVYPRFHPRQTQFAAYVQDSWRVNSRLTLDLGLRYEYWTPIADAGGLNSILDETALPDGKLIYAGRGPLPAQTSQSTVDAFAAAGLEMESASQAGLPLSLFTMPKNNWEPRVGFAYQLSDRMVLRGGWGIYKWMFPIQYFQQGTDSNPPFTFNTEIQPGVVNGAATNATAAELEFPIASANFGGPQPINQFMLGSQNCSNQSQGTCTPPGLFIDTSKVSISQGSGFPFLSVGPRLEPSTSQEYNLTLGWQLPWRTGAQVSYIGNYYRGLPQMDPINYLVPRDSCAAAGSRDVAACESGTPQFRRPYAVFGTSAFIINNALEFRGYGNTNEFQAQLTHTVGGGLLLQAYFTWMRALNTVGGSIGPEAQLVQLRNDAIPASLTPGFSLANPTTTGWSDARRTAALYSNDPALADKTFQLTANYRLPFGRGQRFLSTSHGVFNAIVSGYSIAPFFLWHSGFYFAPYSTPLSSNSNAGIPGGRGIGLAPGKSGILPKSERNPDHWFDASIWDPLATSGPTSGPYNGQTYMYTQTIQQGDFVSNIPFNYMTGPGFNELDLGLRKSTPIWRTVDLDFAAQIFNVYNHQNWALPNNRGIITAPLAGSLPRTIQLQAKVVF